MTYVLKVMRLLYDTLNSNMSCKVYSNVPDDASPPYIRIGEIHECAWLLSPASSIMTITVAAFSELSSSSEVIELGRNMVTSILQNITHSRYAFVMNSSIMHNSIFQLANRTWVVELQIQINVITDN